MLVLELDEVMGVRWVGDLVEDGDNVSALALEACTWPAPWPVVVDGRRLPDVAGKDSYSLRTWCGTW